MQNETKQNLVMIPGLNNSTIIFDGVKKHLSPSINSVAVDVPALEDVESIADQLLKELPADFHLLGYSFGGYIALAILDKAPERVKSLALVSSVANADNDKMKQVREAAIQRVEAGEYEEMVRASASKGVHPDHVDRQDITEIREQMMQEYGADRYRAHLRATASRPDRAELLSTIDYPVLIVGSPNDQVVPFERQQNMVEHLQHPIVKEIEDAGHLIPLEQPEKLANLLETYITREIVTV
ncbi:alpha/beta fold hydrolase [Sporosarcina sp. P13]|uniref:alpha/beta fold hydrolase n=1 Tax=Sporosarcina sp. P13 TaxID=2048263 RepID=UPI0013040EEB|nr:alpha/beta hydrolase [Sporosarcina sp. P13]